MARKHSNADEALGEISDALPFGLVNPTNADKIKRKFLRKPYEPEFEYGEMPDLEELRGKLAKIKCGRWRIGELLKEEKAQLFEKIRMCERIGTAEFGDASERVHGKPSRKLINQAYELLEITPEKPNKKIRYDEVKSYIRQTFKLLGFRYSIRKKPMVASAAISQSDRRLHLKAKERFSRNYTLRLCVHEIATHALRSENGREHKYSILQRGTPDYLATEEGLAAYNEERAGVMSPNTLRNYAGRVVAVAFAKQASFVETYEHMLKYFDKKAAFKLTLRSKRGLLHGSQHGACTKDHVYLRGYYQIKDFVAEGGDLAQLHAAKIAVHEVESLKRYLQEPKYIPEPVIEWIRHMELTTD